jgi:hypothetical protein
VGRFSLLEAVKLLLTEDELIHGFNGAREIEGIVLEALRGSCISLDGKSSLISLSNSVSLLGSSNFASSESSADISEILSQSSCVSGATSSAERSSIVVFVAMNPCDSELGSSEGALS